MASITKYFNVSNQIVISYTYDKSAPLGVISPEQSRNMTSISTFNPLLYVANDDSINLLCADKVNECKAGLANSAFYMQRAGKRAYCGTFSGSMQSMTRAEISNETQQIVEGLLSNGKIKRILRPDDSAGSLFYEDSSLVVPVDTLRIYLVSGYMLGSLNGIGIRARASRSEDYSSDFSIKGDTFNLCNVYISKDDLKNCVQWNKNPLYMDGKFYDRHIDIPIPSIFALGKIKEDIDNARISVSSQMQRFFKALHFYSNTPVCIDFFTVEDEFVESKDFIDLTGFNDSRYAGASLFTASSDTTAALKLQSNADYFSVKIFEDEDTDSIVYYPVFGDAYNYADLNVDIMNNIESGSIKMEDLSVKDSVMTGEDFTDAYGDDARKWTIINEISITYNFIRSVIDPVSEIQDAELRIVETKTDYIDYTGKTSSDGAFWRVPLKPVIPDKYGYRCDTINVNVMMHLVNRMTGCDIVRRASLTVDKAYAKYNTNVKKLNVSNLSTWKIVNKIEKKNFTPAALSSSSSSLEKSGIVRSYYDSTNLMIKDEETGNVYAQGQATLKLYHDTHNYLLRVYTMNSQGARIPFNITGVSKYYLTFPTLSGSGIKISPAMDSASTNLGIGSMLFRITQDQVKRIMEVDDSKRYFSLICEGSNGEEPSTLYEGKVAYYTGS